MKITADLIKTWMIIIGMLSGVLIAIHSHATEQIVMRDDMNLAEIQLVKLDMELKWISFTPDDELSSYEVGKRDVLVKERAYWVQRVRDIENN
jgi:hypothetical protein